VTECDSEYQRVSKDELALIHAKLDRLDEAIRGNGKPELQLRLDRLEAAERSRAKLIWIVIGAVTTFALTALWQQMFGG